MNFCTMCQSFYKDPGTCNCYSAVPKRIPEFTPVGPAPVPVRPHDTVSGLPVCLQCGGPLWACRGTHTYSQTTNPGQASMVLKPSETFSIIKSGEPIKLTPPGIPCQG